MNDLDGLVKSIKEALFSSKEATKTESSTANADSNTSTTSSTNDEKIPRKETQ
jgi:hypothetical protein